MRCAVIDAVGSVVNVIEADASVDTLEGFVLINSASANVGDLYVNGEFVSTSQTVVTAPNGNMP